VIASRTPPVEEVIDGETNGYLVDFFDTAAWADRICAALENPADGAAIRREARQTVVERFDLKRVCLPAHCALIHQLTGLDPVPRARPKRVRAARPVLATAR
jgi:glycosyltransferase involved in cell wall biosynthesis